jgi:quercetin dioxygenase-like cupin family protein
MSRDFIKESKKDPKVGTGKKPEGSDRRLYTDENPEDTCKVKFRTVTDIRETFSSSCFKSKSHARQSQIINLVHQRVRAAYQNAKDPKVKKRLKKAFDYAKERKEKSKEKTKRMNKKKASYENNIKDPNFKLGYKIVAFDGKNFLSLQNPEKKYNIDLGDNLSDKNGVFLGTTKDFVIGYYTELTDFEDCLVTCKYNLKNLIKGNPEEEGEVLVRSCEVIAIKLLNEDIKKESSKVPSFFRKNFDYNERLKHLRKNKAEDSDVTEVTSKFKNELDNEIKISLKKVYDENDVKNFWGIKVKMEGPETYIDETFTQMELLELSNSIMEVLEKDKEEKFELVNSAKDYNSPREGKKRWSAKYKKSINCNDPKGFSQKQYCKRKSRGGDYKKSRAKNISNIYKFCSSDKPYVQKNATTCSYTRTFYANTNNEELVWHRDASDRDIKVLAGEGWSIQFENNLPIKLSSGSKVFIPKNSWHRLIKSSGKMKDLLIQINEAYYEKSIIENGQETVIKIYPDSEETEGGIINVLSVEIDSPDGFLEDTFTPGEAKTICEGMQKILSLGYKV